jgi:hypothetical protein
VVLSHWRDGICVASTPIELSEIPALIGVLAEALGDAAAPAPVPSPAAGSLKKLSFWRRLKDGYRPALAKIVVLPHPDGGQREPPSGA